MRTRTTSTGAFVATGNRQTRSRGNCSSAFSAWSNHSGAAAVGIVSTKTITDVAVPGFTSLLKCGSFLPLNPVTISTVVTNRIDNGQPALHEYSSGGCVKRQDQTFGSVWLSTAWLVEPPPWDDDIITDVTNRAVANAKNAVYDALTDASELRKIIQLFRGTVKGVAKWARRALKDALRNIRRRNFRSLKERLDEFYRLFADYWLQYRYGWMPLLYSLQDATKAFNSNIRSGSLIRERAAQQETLDDSITSSWVNGIDHWSTTQTVRGTRTYRAVAYAKVNVGRLKVIGLDPLRTAYEVFPYSFVVDWLINVGAWLQAVSPFSGASLLGVCVSIKDEYLREQHTRIDWSGTNGQGTHSGTSGTCVTQESNRVYNRFPSEVSFPGWNPRINPFRALDLVALARALKGIGAKPFRI